MMRKMMKKGESPLCIRRDFLRGAVTLAALGGIRVAAGEGEDAVRVASPSEPMLQVPSENSVGVVWAVGEMSKGAVEVSRTPDFAEARFFPCGGFGVGGFDDKVLWARLTGLAPATRYFYRTCTTRLDYRRGGYEKRLGERVVSRTHSFTTAGAGAPSHFAMLNDTHMDWQSFGYVTKKLKELKPTVAIWNGDALNATNSIDEVVTALLTPACDARDYASDMPVLFNNGNHEYRGLFMREPGAIILPRLASERRPEFEFLVRNYAVRYGDVALIGLDTGEDRTDDHPWHAGLSHCREYRKLQARWLEDVLSRPDIATAPFVVASCHIPLLPRKSERDNPMWWCQEAAQAWGPVLTKRGVQVLLVGHMHEYRCNPADETRSWVQIEGGGFERGERHIGGHRVVNPNYFPTVIEGEVRSGKLVITAHDVWHDRVVGCHEFKPRDV